MFKLLLRILAEEYEQGRITLAQYRKAVIELSRLRDISPIKPIK